MKGGETMSHIKKDAIRVLSGNKPKRIKKVFVSRGGKRL